MDTGEVVVACFGIVCGSLLLGLALLAFIFRASNHEEPK